MEDAEHLLTQLATDYWGINRAGGVREMVVDLQERVMVLEMESKHYRDKEREATCFGLAEFNKRDKFKKEIDEEVAMVKSAEIQSKDKRMEVHWQSTVQLIGTVALLALGIAQLVAK